MFILFLASFLAFMYGTIAAMFTFPYSDDGEWIKFAILGFAGAVLTGLLGGAIGL